MYSRFLLIVIVLALASLACNMSVDLPQVELQTGPTQTEEIYVPLPAAPGTVTDLELDFAAGEMNISPGAQDALVAGTATYNVEEFKPQVTTKGSQVTVTFEENTLKDIPKIGSEIENRWDLQLGDAPMRLMIRAGAHQSQIELGGIPLRQLSITDAASNTEVDFSSPNPLEMSTFRYETGASQVNLFGLGNANFSSLVFQGGAGDYTLDFSGQLTRSADIRIETGLSSLTLIVPEGVPARVTVEGGLSNVQAEDAWQVSDGKYSLEGSGPALTIAVKIGAGNLVLRNE